MIRTKRGTLLGTVYYVYVEYSNGCYLRGATTDIEEAKKLFDMCRADANCDFADLTKELVSTDRVYHVRDPEYSNRYYRAEILAEPFYIQERDYDFYDKGK